jgi:hypothetical protein
VAQMMVTSTSYSLVDPSGVDAPLLQHAQQAGLQVRRHVADFVQKQGAAVGLQDFAGEPLRRAPVKAPSS